MPFVKMAEEVYAAAMEMRDYGINRFGSEFEDELLEVVNSGDSKIENHNIHINCKDCEDIKNAVICSLF